MPKRFLRRGMLPEGTGVPLSGFMSEMFTSPSPKAAFKGSPNCIEVWFETALLSRSALCYPCISNPSQSRKSINHEALNRPLV
jgi:hypothetical protein